MRITIMRLVSFVWVCFVLLMLGACDSQEKNVGEEYNKFDKTEIVISKVRPDTTIHVMCSSNNKCLYYESKFDMQDGKPIFVITGIYEYDYSEGEKRELNFPNNIGITCRYTPDDDLIIKDENQIFYLLNSQREICNQIDLAEVRFEQEELEDTKIHTVVDVDCDGRYIYVIGRNEYNQNVIAILDMNLDGKAFFKTEGEYFSCLNRNNQIQFIDYEKRYVYIYNEEKQQLINIEKLPNNIFDDTVSIQYFSGNDEYDFFYYTRGNIIKESGKKEDYLVGIKNNKSYKLADFNTLAIEQLYIENINWDGHDGFWIWGIDLNQEMKLYHLTLSNIVQNYSTKDQKECCRIGSLFIPDESIQYALNSYNQISDKYYFELVIYQNIYEDRDIALMHLFMDCQNGNLDGVILDEIEEEIVKNDVMDDLESYFSYSKVVKKNDFITHYFESVTDSKGKIYALYPSFEGFGYAYDELIDFTNLLDYKELCEPNKNFMSFCGVDNELDYLLTYSGNIFINEDKGEIHINEPQFRNMLQFIKIQSENKPQNYDSVIQYCAGESLATRIRILEPTSYLYFDELFDHNVIFSNVGAEGLVISKRKGELGICVQSENKEAFYEFYDFLFEPIFYHNLYFSGLSMPVVNREYEMWEEFFLATVPYVDKYGKYHDIYDYQFGIGEAECIIEAGSISEQKAKEAIEILRNIQYVKPMKDIYKTIIVEESMDFFVGKKSIDEVCDSIEKRLTIAIEENKN